MEKNTKYKNLYILKSNNQNRALMTIIRNKDTRRNDFIFYSDRLTRILIENALELLPVQKKTVDTPLNVSYDGLTFEGKICAVSVIRAGDSMLNAVREVCKKIRIGKILIQRNEATAEAIYYYKKFPTDISERFVLLLDPMLATGGSICEAIKILKQSGVKEEKIIFVNLLSCYEGLKTTFEKYPKIRILTTEIDKGLDSKHFISPGLGDFGDRYFGT